MIMSFEGYQEALESQKHKEIKLKYDATAIQYNAVTITNFNNSIWKHKRPKPG